MTIKLSQQFALALHTRIKGTLCSHINVEKMKQCTFLLPPRHTPIFSKWTINHCIIMFKNRVYSVQSILGHIVYQQWNLTHQHSEHKQQHKQIVEVLLQTVHQHFAPIHNQDRTPYSIFLEIQFHPFL